jgi:hypothetical protein
MTFQKVVLQLAACSAIACAQSASIGLGTNPDAQGATEEVTPGAGPNGYGVFTHAYSLYLQDPQIRGLA